MPNYQNSKIYTIKSEKYPDKIYVGSTTQKIENRWRVHKYVNSKSNINLYKEHITNFDEWYIELYENYPCNSIEELTKKEDEIIQKIGTLNTQKDRAVSYFIFISLFIFIFFNFFVNLKI